MTFAIEVFNAYPTKLQEDFLRIYEDQVNPKKPDHSLLELVVELMATQGSTLYAIKQEDSWVGAGVVLDEEGLRVMRYCCVAPPLRNEGIGAHLVDALANKEAESGVKELITEIEVEDRSAERFLKQNQFSETERDEETVRMVRKLS